MTTSETTILVAIVGLISALTGGLIQALAARKSEQFKFVRQTKWELYSQYFLVLGELTFAEDETERHINALSLMAQLRGRIGIVGSVEVVRAVGAMFEYPDLRSDDAQSSMARVLNAMRRDVGDGGKQIADDEMVRLMFTTRDWAQ